MGFLGVRSKFVLQFSLTSSLLRYADMIASASRSSSRFRSNDIDFSMLRAVEVDASTCRLPPDSSKIVCIAFYAVGGILHA